MSNGGCHVEDLLSRDDVAVFTLTASSLHAQQQEASLLKVEMPGQGFDLVFAMAKPGGARNDLRGMPDLLVVYAGDGELAFAIDDKTQGHIQRHGRPVRPGLHLPGCVRDRQNDTGLSLCRPEDGKGGRGADGLARSPNKPEPFMHKVGVPGTEGISHIPPPGHRSP